MNFSIYLDDATGSKIAELALQEQCSRNAIIREAIDTLLEQRKQQQPARKKWKEWPADIKNFKGVDLGFRFEDFRNDLLPPKEDIFPE